MNCDRNPWEPDDDAAPLPDETREFEVTATFVLHVRCRNVADGQRDAEDRIATMARAGRAAVQHVETKLVAGEPFLTRKATEPFPADDPMLPSGQARFGPCPDCGAVHRLDLGCPVANQGRLRLVALVVVLFLCGIAAGVWGCTGAVR